MPYDTSNLANATAFLNQARPQMYTPTNGANGMPSGGWDGWNHYNSATNYANTPFHLPGTPSPTPSVGLPNPTSGGGGGGLGAPQHPMSSDLNTGGAGRTPRHLRNNQMQGFTAQPGQMGITSLPGSTGGQRMWQTTGATPGMGALPPNPVAGPGGGFTGGGNPPPPNGGRIEPAGWTGASPGAAPNGNTGFTGIGMPPPTVTGPGITSPLGTAPNMMPQSQIPMNGQFKDDTGFGQGTGQMPAWATDQMGGLQQMVQTLMGGIQPQTNSGMQPQSAHIPGQAPPPRVPNMSYGPQGSPQAPAASGQQFPNVPGGLGTRPPAWDPSKSTWENHDAQQNYLTQKQQYRNSGASPYGNMSGDLNSWYQSQLGQARQGAQSWADVQQQNAPEFAGASYRATGGMAMGNMLQQAASQYGRNSLEYNQIHQALMNDPSLQNDHSGDPGYEANSAPMNLGQQISRMTQRTGGKGGISQFLQRRFG